jgi:3-isopropylmalate/(R)-2-methylmalate dehydratase small subunit
MVPFITLDGIAAPLPLMNIDTDMIIPKQFLKTIKRTGLGRHLFYEMRFDYDGKPVADFVLNRQPYQQARFLVAGDNFGCGSSREHAPWALADFGIRCIIAPGFAVIFYNNCFKNGILPLVLNGDLVEELMAQAQAGTNFTVDLPAQVLKAASQEYPFVIDPFRKKCLLEGLDDIALTLRHIKRLDQFEAARMQDRPWLWQT